MLDNNCCNGMSVDKCRKIIDKGGDYLLAVKGNQGRLHGAFLNHFSFKQISEIGNNNEDVYHTSDIGHDREESRSHLVRDTLSVICLMNLLICHLNGKE